MGNKVCQWDRKTLNYVKDVFDFFILVLKQDLPNLKILDLRHSLLLTTTPDFNGLPCLETLILGYCRQLKEIHPSIGYHERLISVNMRGCIELKTFPPIIRMKQLKTLELSYCFELQMFPDIRTNMDSLVNLQLEYTDIEIIPPSVGQFCTNLVSFNLRYCYKLKRIEGNFRLLKSLKDLHLHGCRQLEKLARNFFDEKCCLEVLSLAIKSTQESTSSKNLKNRICLQSCFHQNTSVSLQKLPQFPLFLRKLNLSECNFGDGDIPSDFLSGLLNLQVLDLSGNQFSRLHFNLSQIPCLKFLALSYCKHLVEVSGIPSSIAILKANSCDSLESVGDLSNYKWLWKVSLWNCKKLTEVGERMLHSMLQVNAVEDRFMNFYLPQGPSMTHAFSELRSLTLQLPHDWYRDFSGFLLWADIYDGEQCVIVLKQGMLSIDSQPGHRGEEFDKSPESYEYERVCYVPERVCYVPFGALRHTSWWNPTCTNISVQIRDQINTKVELVPRNSKLDYLNETPIDCSEFCDEEYEDRKTFEIIHDSKSSSIQIVWSNLF